jgi:hypothetical protein
MAIVGRRDLVERAKHFRQLVSRGLVIERCDPRAAIGSCPSADVPADQLSGASGGGSPLIDVANLVATHDD